MVNRLVLIVSGLQYSGKSYLLKRLLARLELADAVAFPIDPIRIALYGDRADTHVTKTEHLFKNEWSRYEMLRALVLGRRVVASEMVMLTRSGHQGPMLEMVARAEQYVQIIEREYAQRDGLPPPVPSQVQLKVLLPYASLDCIAERLTANQEERRQSGSIVFDWRGMFGGYSQFEFPDASTYEPLYLDTSDESAAANEARLAEILAFLKDELDLKVLNSDRRLQAQEYQRQIFARIQQEMAK